ncbi:MAG: T9SS type A sorting domain-containing protein [Bacteroidetes bacterium]|nr:T9SS type A sorting domain-containing protein [Bacteroidota bacterium]
MHARVLSLILTLLVSSFLIPVSAQIYQPEGLNIPGEWNGWTNPPAAGPFLSSSQAGGLVNLITTGERRWTTTFQSGYTGSRQFLFTSGPNGSPYNNKWGGVTTTLNTIQNYFYQSGTNNSVNVTNGKYYTINWDDNGYVNTNAIVMETSNAPVTISSDSQNPAANAVYNYNSVIVTASLSASLSPEEKVYLRYSTDNWVNITNVLMTVSGSTAQAVIPSFATGTNVSYSIVTTTRTFASNEGNYNADLSTIRRNENNRTYTILAPSDGCVAVGNPSDWGINQWNVYVYNASSANAWVNNYVGYYSMPDLSFNTSLNQTNSNFYSWNINGSPANAPGYQGCTAGNDNHSFRMKRQGFPCGAYQISVTDIDDLGELYVNGTLVWKNHVCCGLSSAVWGGYLDGSSTVEFKVLEIGGGSVCGLTFASLPEPTAVITPTNPTEINCNGVITLSNVSGGACHLVSAPFNGVIPSGSSFYGSGQIPSGDPNYCMLTPNSGGQLGTWAYTPTYRPTAFSVRYRQYMGQGSEADGISFNYGNFNPAVGGGESGFGKLVIAFKTYGADVVELLYDGVLIASYSPSFGLSNEAWTPTQIDISADGKVTLIFNGTTVFNQVQLPAGYATADKSNWIYAFSGRTGADTDLQAIDDLTIYSRDNLEFFVSGVTSSWTTSKTINAPAGTYTVEARNVCGTGCTYTLGSVTIIDPSSPSLTLTSTNGTGQSYNDGVADCGMSSSTFGWLTDGSYSVTVNGCTNANYTVTEQFVVNGTVQNTETWNLSGTATWTPNRFWSVGVTTVNVTVTDSEGNAFTTTYTVTITDNEPLSIVAPADITACSGTTVDLGSATVGGCWTNVSNNAPANLPIGNTTITWTITGASGNTATDTQIVTIIETVTPTVTISASPDLQVCPFAEPGGNDENMIFFTASTTNCGDNPTYQWYVNGNDTWGNEPNVSGDVFIGGEQIYVTVIPTNDCQTSSLVTSNILVPVAMNAQSYYVDYDGDGYGNSFNSQMACSPQPGLTTVGGDCDDYNANAYPGATEICGNGIDDDCIGGDLACNVPGCTDNTACNYNSAATNDDGSCSYGSSFYADTDNDGYGAGTATQACTQPSGFVTNNTDCNDSSSAVYPGATETCNSIDDDCDGSTDEGVQSTFYADADGDGFGELATSTDACTAPTGYVSNSTDCDDSDNALYPGATETCNDIDDDCDGTADDGLQTTTYYVDGDGDGFGTTTSADFCEDPGVGYATNNTDCNDTNAQINQTATELCNGIDDNCNNQTDEGLPFTNYYVDSDGDGFGAGTAASFCANPGASYATTNTDCNNGNANIYPGANEICNGVDDDCDGSTDEGVLNTYYADADGDGYGNSGNTQTACSQPTGYVTIGGDCFDGSAAINPGATEICNNIDDNCDGTIDNAFVNYYADSDGDGFGGGNAVSIQSCTTPAGYTTSATDCNNANANVYPGAIEICNGIDDDCDSNIDEGVLMTYYLDSDGDGFGGTTSTTGCSAPNGYVSSSTDCNDTNSAVNPGATEVCNSIDDDCDGTTDEGCPSTTPGEEPSNAVSAPSSYYSYCSNFYGTLAGALPSTYAQSTCVTGEDKWYTFTALSSGVTIFIGSYFNDILIELQDVNGNLIETENAVNGIGTEVMNYVGLTAGQVYRVGVRNYNSNLAAGNQFSGCIRHLKRGGCDSGTVGGGNWPSQISMCSVFKATYAGSGVQYRYTWTGLTGGATGNVYTRTQSSDYLSLTNVTPTLQSGCQYSVLVTNLYTIANGAGVNEVLEVPALAPCTITILADATVQLRSTDQCSNGPRFRSSVVASLPWVCGVNNWRWRFTEVNPSTYQVIGLPIEINRGAASNYLNLGTVAALQYGKTYAVQTAPVFTYTGSNYQWGPSHYLCIIGLSGMTLNNTDQVMDESNKNENLIVNEFELALYPNPTNGDELNITLSGVSGDDQSLVRIMNTFGQIVYEGKWNAEGVIQKQVNVSRWSNGMYLFEVRSGDQTLTKRFMISQ